MIKIKQAVGHPYKIGYDNLPLRGQVVGLPTIYINTPYWDILWEGDKQPEVCERCDFIIKRKELTNEN